jgi:hypothetical protein
VRFSMVDLPLFEVRSKTVGLGVCHSTTAVVRFTSGSSGLLDCTLNLDSESKEDTTLKELFGFGS